MKPFLLVLSAPSGGGKSSIARNLLQGRDDLGYSVSATTRPIREGEREGVDYYFLTREEFVRRRDAGFGPGTMGPPCPSGITGGSSRVSSYVFCHPCAVAGSA